MKKKLIGILVGLALISPAAVIAKSTPLDIGKMQTQSFNPQGERQYDGRLFLEFAKPVSSFAPGEAVSLVAKLSKDAAVGLTFEEVMMKRFVVVKLKNARSDADVVSAISRISSADGVLNVKPNRYVKAQSVSSFPNPGWSAQFNTYSASSDSNGNPYVNNPRILELIDLFDGFNFGTSRLSLVDSFFDEVPNMPHSIYVQKQTILNGVFSNNLVGRGPSNAHGLTMAAYLKGQPNATYGTVGIGYNTLPLLAITVFDPQTNQATDFDVARGMLYSFNLHDSAATNPNPNPATVVNLSLGSGGNVCSDSAVYQPAIDMINNAGGLVVAAAGNLGRTELNIPSNCDNVIAVGAAGYNANIASFSNYTPDLTVSAISSTSDTNEGGGNGALFTTNVVTSPDGRQDGVVLVSGTSVAAPYISLLLTYAKALDPTLTFSEAESLLKRNSIPFRAEDTRCAGLTRCGGIIDPVAFVQEVAEVNLLSFNQYSTSAATPPDEEPPVEEPPVENTVDPVTVSISGTASNPTNVRVFQGTTPVTIDGIQTTEGSITLDFGSAGLFTVTFTGTPNTNTNSVTTSSTANYRFTVDTRVSPATVSMVERVDAPAAPNTPVSSSESSGSGGGGAMSLAGLFAMASLFGLMNRRKRGVLQSR